MPTTQSDRPWSPPASSHTDHIRIKMEGIDISEPLDQQASKPVQLTPRPPPASVLQADPDASIVLVGTRCTGKTSLAYLAAIALNRQVVEIAKIIEKEAGMPLSKVVGIYGLQGFRQLLSTAIPPILKTHSRGAVIVVASNCMSSATCNYLRDFGKDHLVINILREPERILPCLGIASDNVEHIKTIASQAHIFRSCTSLDFFNIHQEPHQTTNSPTFDLYRESTLPLKRAGRLFLKFLAAAGLPLKIPGQYDTFPLDSVPTELRNYTCAISVPLRALEYPDPSIDIEDLEIGSDAFEISVETGVRHDPYSPQNGLIPATSWLVQSKNLSKAVAQVREKTAVPTILHVQPRDESLERHLHDTLQGPEYQSNVTAEYLDAFRTAMRTAPEYATLELFLDPEVVRELVNNKGSTKMIAYAYCNSPGNRTWSNNYWKDVYQRAVELGFDLVRIGFPTSNVEAAESVNEFKFWVDNNVLAKDRIPMILYNTEVGSSISYQNWTLTPVTHPSLKKFDWYTEGCDRPLITAKDIMDAQFAASIFAGQYFHVFGASTAYSLSPAMHTAGYQALHLKYTYTPLEGNTIDVLLKQAKQPSFGGSSIAHPFKVETIKYTDSISDHARAIGAINTLIPLRHVGQVPASFTDIINDRANEGPVVGLHGDNTDWIGIRALINRGLKPVSAISIRSVALVIGAGGMARAAIYAMLHLGVHQIVVTNRTKDRAVEVIEHFRSLIEAGYPFPVDRSKIQLILLPFGGNQWPQGLLLPTVIVSCIPTHAIGNNPSPEFELPEAWLKAPYGGVVVELGYKDLNTPLLKQVRKKARQGWVALSGMDLLPEQGFAQFEVFTGRRAPRKLMSAAVLKAADDEGIVIHEQLD